MWKKEKLKPQSHLADLASRLTSAEKIGSTLKHSECISGLVWVIVNRWVTSLTVLKFWHASRQKFMSGSSHYMLVTSIGRFSMKSFMVRMLVCLRWQNDYILVVRKLRWLVKISFRCYTDYEKALKWLYKEELWTCPGCNDLIKIASRLH